jgi:hypothetical protein
VPRGPIQHFVGHSIDLTGTFSPRNRMRGPIPTVPGWDATLLNGPSAKDPYDAAFQYLYCSLILFFKCCDCVSTQCSLQTRIETDRSTSDSE